MLLLLLYLGRLVGLEVVPAVLREDILRSVVFVMAIGVPGHMGSGDV
jgi:hypothetical protein